MYLVNYYLFFFYFFNKATSFSSKESKLTPFTLFFFSPFINYKKLFLAPKKTKGVVNTVDI